MPLNAFLDQGLALALLVSQVIASPEEVRKRFDPAADQAAAAQTLVKGCAAFRKAYEEDASLDDLDAFEEEVKTMVDFLSEDGQKALPRGITRDGALSAFRLACRGEVSDPEGFSRAIEFYNAAMANLPDPNVLRAWRLPQTSMISAADGAPVALLHRPNGKRRFVPLQRIPRMLIDAIVAIEDKTFWEHRGIVLSGIARAARSSGESGRPQGGSTITMQTVKNTIFGEQFTRENGLGNMMVRKIQEIALASAVEEKAILSKEGIMELYLNVIFFGRGAWGIEAAARAYFDKSVSDLTLVECAFLAGLPKNPNGYDPAIGLQAAQKRTAEVLTAYYNAKKSQTSDEAALRELRSIYDEAFRSIAPMTTKLAERTERPERRPTIGRYFVDYVARQIRAQANVEAAESPLSVRTTMDADLQLAAEKALQEGLYQVDLSRGRAMFSGAEANLAPRVQALSREDAGGSGPAWLRALRRYRPIATADVHWPLAVVLPSGAARAQEPAPQQRPGRGNPQRPTPQPGGAGAQLVGLEDGRTVRLVQKSGWTNRLVAYDVVRVQVSGQGNAASADLRGKPQVQGAIVAMDSATGDVLALSGGFSYNQNQYNYGVDSKRQPGSTVKPLTYLAALASGIQPDALILDGPADLPAPEGPWSPNDDSGSESYRHVTVRTGLESSLNRVTANLLKVIHPEPYRSLDLVQTGMKQCGLYGSLGRNFASILGAEETTLLNLVSCYAALSNEGVRPIPRFIQSVEVETWSGATPISRPLGFVNSSSRSVRMTVGDPVAFFQLRTLLQGVIARGTAAALNNSLKDVVPRGRGLWEYMGGKTGTTQRSNDAWFIGFTKDLTIGVWVGYDNGRGRRPLNLGGGTGAGVAAPIFASFMKTVAAKRPLAPLPGPSAEVRRLTNQSPAGAPTSSTNWLRKDGAIVRPPPLPERREDENDDGMGGQNQQYGYGAYR